MASSITLLSAEIEGRAYGGGVLKLETKEAERLLVPVASQAQRERLAAVFPDIDALIQGGDVEAAARIADDAVGIDHDQIWDAYLTFRSRRLGRRRTRVA
jgi:adenine-specific DNA-methyltransferase